MGVGQCWAWPCLKLGEAGQLEVPAVGSSSQAEADRHSPGGGGAGGWCGKKSACHFAPDRDVTGKAL